MSLRVLGVLEILTVLEVVNIKAFPAKGIVTIYTKY